MAPKKTPAPAKPAAPRPLTLETLKPGDRLRVITTAHPYAHQVGRLHSVTDDLLWIDFEGDAKGLNLADVERA